MLNLQYQATGFFLLWRFETDQNSEPHRGFLLEFNTDFKVVQYNGRGILLADPHARQLAGKCIKDLFKSAHVLCLQEVHCHSQEIESCFSLWLPGWKILASAARGVDGSHNVGAGGMVGTGVGVGGKAPAAPPK